MIHYMKLQDDPFIKIKNKNKTIEMRLNDEKRKKINIGDNIEFTNIKTEEKMTCKVLGLYHYKNFEELYDNHDKISIGYEDTEIANPEDMSAYYDEKEILKYGVLGIEIKIINTHVDIGINEEFGSFKFRVGIVLIKNNKLLCMKAKKFDGYVLPGGHVELNELSNQAVLREGKEELGTEVVIKDLLCVHENLFYNKGKVFNEICYYYIVDTKNSLPIDDFIVSEIDKGISKKHSYVWLEIKTLEKNNLRPTSIAKLIQDDIKETNKIIITRE